jgi:hypothetical protein
MGKCRDCEVCTRLGIVKFFRLPLTIIWKFFLSWNVGLFIRKCPECGHFLSQHKKRSDGSFTD